MVGVDKIGVHVTHCCIVHGCKYGDRDCPVVLGKSDQHYLCEDCKEAPFASTKSIKAVFTQTAWDRVKQHKRKLKIDTLI